MRALIVISALALSACANFTNEDFDPVEISRYSDIAVVASDGTKLCGTPHLAGVLAEQLRTMSNMAQAYSATKVTNERVAEAGKVVFKLSTEMTQRYLNSVPTETYCKLKLLEISTAAKNVSSSIGKKVSK